VNAYILLFGDLMRRLGWGFPVLIALTALVGLGESTSVVLLLPLLNRIGVTAANQGAASKLVNESLALIGVRSSVQILAVVIAVATTQAALSLALNWWTIRLARRYQAQRQIEMFSAFMRAKWSFIAEKKAGEMTNAIVTECDRLGRAFTIAMALLGSFVVAVIYAALSLLIAWQVALSLVGFALAAGLAMTRLYKKSYVVGRTVAPLNAELQSALNESFAGARFIKASAGIGRATARVEPLVLKLGDANAFASVMPGTVRGVLEYIALIGLAGVLVVTSKELGVAPANAVVVLALFGRLFPRLTQVQAQLHTLNGHVHAIEVLNKLQTAAEAEAEPEDRSSERLKVNLPAVLTIKDLRVKFAEREVLTEIGLTMPLPGLIAIIGRSGAGKSTLVHALLGLVEPSAGSIRLGAHDLASAPLNAWRRAIGYVPQETILFHTSIRDNLTLINPAASDAEIKAAAQRAHAYDFIKAWPDGFDTMIGDQGVKLSGGQRQRLGIARALLANPVLLLMDEAMSALDAESEAELLRTVDELRKEMGVLIVAHRLAAVRAADAIYVMDGGRIVESGTWNELMARRTRLYSLVEAQSIGDDQAMTPV
jgi:ATP-binding cassette subfamily C protein